MRYTVHELISIQIFQLYKNPMVLQVSKWITGW